MRSKLICLVCCLVVVLVFDAVACAAEDLKLLINELKVFPVARLKRIAVGSPDVADITILHESEVMMVAKKEGLTTLIIWDDAGERSFNVKVIKRDMQQDVKKINDLFVASGVKGVNVTTEEGNIYVMGEVATEVDLDKIKNILASFDNTVNITRVRDRQPLVNVAVKVLEVNYDDMKRLGFDWSNLQPITYTEPFGPQAGEQKDIKNQTTGKFPKLWRTFKWDRSTINARLNLLIETDRARTLASPNLVTLSGKEASFQVGGEVPYVTVETEGRTSVEWKDYGIILKVSPIVTANKEIKTQISAEVTALDWGNAVSQEGYSIPAIAKREVQTEVFLNAGDTIFLAGLINSEDSRNVTRLPWLSTVPILGELFKSTEFRDDRTELVISITTNLMGKESLDEQEDVLGETSALKSSNPFDSYAQMIGDLVSSSVVYPLQAQEANQEGMVKINLEISSSGNLRDARVVESSGYDMLDRSALAAVLEQAPYPSFPPDVSQKELRLTIPVLFKNYAMYE